MRRKGNLVERIAELDNLYLAFYKASKGKRAKTEVIRYAEELDKNLQKLRCQILSGNISVGHYHYFTIWDPKKRVICAATFAERVLHHAIMNVCHPYFERNLINDTFATRIGKGIYVAVEKGMKAMSRYSYVCKLDVRKYFDSVSHKVLKNKLGRLFKDKALLEIMGKIIDSYQTEEGRGIPIGNLTSQYFANFYLSALDHSAKERLNISVYLRYMDDILFFGDDKTVLRSQVDAMVEQMKELNLVFKSPIIVSTEVGIPFLGYKLCRHRLTLGSRGRNRLKSKLCKYDGLLFSERWSENEYRKHIAPLFAFAEKAYTKKLRKRIIEKQYGQKLEVRTACCAAVAGTTTRGTAECRTETTTNRATRTTTTDFVLSFPSLRFQGMDFPMRD